MVELLTATVHRIGARAERRVTNELINAFKKMTGKENILFWIAEAALAAPARWCGHQQRQLAHRDHRYLRQIQHRIRNLEFGNGPIRRDRQPVRLSSPPAGLGHAVTERYFFQGNCSMNTFARNWTRSRRPK